MKHDKVENNANSERPAANPNFHAQFYNDGDESNEPSFNFIQGLPPPLNNDEDFILQNVINSSEFPEQPIFDFHNNLLNVQDPTIESFYSPIVPVQDNAYMVNRNEPNNPSLYSSQQPFKLESGTPSPSPFVEEKVNLDETTNNCDQIPGGNYVAPIPSNPLLVLSILPWTGPYNFRINIPEPNLLGVKPKWCYSKVLGRMYVAKNVAFPLNIMLDKYPARAYLNICPVYNKSSNRMAPVHRCPNCRISDPNQDSCQHVIQVEGSSAYYYEQEERYMVSVPLGTPAPGDSLVNLFLKVCCNTSCIGGPNRRTFSILISLKLGDNEYGRQVIDVKCCEGPTRDMNRDEKNQRKESILQPVNQNTNENMEKFREVASEVARSRCSSTPTRKRKVSEPDFGQHKKEALEMEMIMVPKIYIKRVKKYINMMYVKDQMRKVYPQYYSNNKIFKTSSAESD